MYSFSLAVIKLGHQSSPVLALGFRLEHNIIVFPCPQAFGFGLEFMSSNLCDL
jgi:hypothetical protein